MTSKKSTGSLKTARSARKSSSIDNPASGGSKKKLSPDEEKHRYILSNMQEGYYELDLNGNFTFVNPAMCQSLGLDASSLLTMNYRQCVSPQSAQLLEETFQKVYTSGKAAKVIEYELVQKDGLKRTHEMSVSLFRSTSGEPLGFFGISTDRTDALHLERALRESEASYHEVMDLCPDTISINNFEDGRYINVNKAFTRYTGYSAEEMIGRTPAELNIFATQEDQTRLAHGLRSGSIDGMELRFRAKDGKLFDGLVSGRRIQFKGKDCFLFVATVITPLKEIQSALRESEESYRRVLEVAPDAITISRLADGKYFEVNDYFCHKTGYRRDEVIGRTIGDLNIYANPEDRKGVVAALREQGRVDGMEIVFRAKDGTLLITLVSARIMMFKNEECVLIITTLINDIKETQRALLESERRYRTILDAAPDAICLTRLSDGKYIEANTTFYQRSGYTPEETIGRTSSDLRIYVNPDDRKELLAALEQKGQVDGLEIQVRHKDGSLSHNLWSCRVIEHNAEKCLLVVSKEIDELKKAQKALVESEESYRTILDTAPYTVAITSLHEGRFLLVNEAFCRNTGFGREEAIGHTVNDLDLYEKAFDREAFLRNYRQKGYVDGMEIRFKRRDDVITTGLISARPITFRNQRCLLIVATNIDALKLAQRALEESEESYRTVIHTTPDAIAIIGRLDSNIIEINDAFSVSFGFSRQEIIGRNARELNLFVDPNDCEKITNALKNKGRLEGLEIRLRNKEGAISENLLSVTPLRYRSEEAFLVSSVDITVLKEYQRAFHESEENYRRIMESAPYSIMVSRLSDLCYVEVNDSFCRRTGFSREETLGRTPQEMGLYTDPEEGNRLLTLFNSKGRIESSEMQFRAKDGRSITNLISSIPIRFHGEDCILSMTVDITARKRAEQELAQYRQHLEDMVQARTQALEAAQNELVKREKLAVLGQLTAIVSHELRNPLGVIRSSNFFLQRKITQRDEKIDKHFRRIEEQVALCDAIVADLLEYTRGRSASLVKEDLTPWLIQVIEQLKESHGLHIEQALTRPLPIVPHDPEKMRRVIINVLDNAIQAVKAKMPAENEGPSDYNAKIKVKSYPTPNQVVIEITDNGIGMTEETLQRAFEPLFTTRARGTGIGLAIVKKVVKEHNGDVFLESTPGEGTKLTIALPRTIQQQVGKG